VQQVIIPSRRGTGVSENAYCRSSLWQDRPEKTDKKFGDITNVASGMSRLLPYTLQTFGAATGGIALKG
jgi:hypothetical protein